MKIKQNNFIKELRTATSRLEEGNSLSGSELAKFVSSVADFEIEEGGPYAIAPTGGGEKADVGFNLLIAYFLSLCEVDLPKLNDFLKNRLTEESSDLLDDAELQELSEKWREIRANNEKPEVRAKTYSAEEQEVMDRIRAVAKERFADFPKEFRGFALECMERTIAGNKDKQMSLMSYYTRQSLGKKARKISDKMIAEMGLANIFFWAAFIIYDDFWDEDEAANPRVLPVANLYARHYVDFFSSLLPERTGFHDFYHKIMDNLDSANNWETLHCRAEVRGSKFIIPERLPDYGDYEFKFRPASGHIVGPVAILLQIGYKMDSVEVKNFISYFKNYLIAMQINDDSHDWEEDLRRGHLSTVVAELLKDYKEKHPNKKEIDLDAELLELKKIFWFTTISKMAQVAIKHTKRSRKALRSITAFEDTSPLERFVTITENVAKLALDEQEKTVDFLHSYHG
jgi:hypothetical protein